MENLVIVFVKYPEPGLVKTRLAGSIGEESAAFLYRCFTADVMEKLAGISFPAAAACDPARPLSDYRE